MFNTFLRFLALATFLAIIRASVGFEATVFAPSRPYLVQATGEGLMPQTSDEHRVRWPGMDSEAIAWVMEFDWGGLKS